MHSGPVEVPLGRLSGPGLVHLGCLGPLFDAAVGGPGALLVGDSGRDSSRPTP